MTPTEKQAAYAARRAAHTGAKPYTTHIYLVTLPDGTQVREQVIGLSQVAAYHPQAVRVEMLQRVEPLRGAAAVEATKTGSFW